MVNASPRLPFTGGLQKIQETELKKSIEIRTYFKILSHEWSCATKTDLGLHACTQQCLLPAASLIVALSQIQTAEKLHHFSHTWFLKIREFLCIDFQLRTLSAHYSLVDGKPRSIQVR